MSRAAPKVMSLESIKKITDNFSPERVLGSGSFGKVYKGEQNGDVIAVKLLHLTPGVDESEQFKLEFENLWRISEHPNIIKLVGYCYEIKKEFVHLDDGRTTFADNIYRVLCLEYMHNGSLQRHLTADESQGFDWQTRYKIIKGLCQGLKHLHHGLEKPIHHLDLKPDNILLDKNMVPKLSDFGLSKLASGNETRVTLRVLGTLGYLPPEYITQNLVSDKFDIYAMGVIILRVIAGNEGYRKLLDMPPEQFIGHVCENWMKRLRSTQRSIALEVECYQVKRCIEIGLACTDQDRKKRPTIGDIINSLNEIEHPATKLPRSVPHGKGTAYNKGNIASKELRHIEREESTSSTRSLPGPRNVVLYTTTMSAIRKTFDDCNEIREQLRSFGINFKEKDLFDRPDHKQELKKLMNGRPYRLPVLSIDGEPVGDSPVLLEKLVR